MRLENNVNDAPYVDVTVIFDAMRTQGRKLRWLADATGVSLSYVSKMQYGSRPARREWANKAAVALGLPASLFLPQPSRHLDEPSSVARQAVA
jgi:hypothetical protein